MRGAARARCQRPLPPRRSPARLCFVCVLLLHSTMQPALCPTRLRFIPARPSCPARAPVCVDDRQPSPPPRPARTAAALASSTRRGAASLDCVSSPQIVDRQAIASRGVVSAAFRIHLRMDVITVSSASRTPCNSDASRVSEIKHDKSRKYHYFTASPPLSCLPRAAFLSCPCHRAPSPLCRRRLESAEKQRAMALMGGWSRTARGV